MLTVYANDDDPDDYTTVYGEDEFDAFTDIDSLDEFDLNELLESFDLSELLEMFGGFDISSVFEPSNQSSMSDNSKPFTPDGQATVLDLTYEGDGKMFYTFRTPAGNVFYLIIDRQRGVDNVYCNGNEFNRSYRKRGECSYKLTAMTKSYLNISKTEIKPRLKKSGQSAGSR